MLKKYNGWKLYANNGNQFFDGLYVDKDGSTYGDDTPLKSFDGVDDIPEAVTYLVNKYYLPQENKTQIAIASVDGKVYLAILLTFFVTAGDDPEEYQKSKEITDNLMDALSSNTGFDVLDVSSEENDSLDYDLLIPASQVDEFEDEYHVLNGSCEEDDNLDHFVMKYYDRYDKLKNASENQMYEANRQKLYHLYQLDWMMSHGYSISDVISECEKLASDFAVDYANSLPDSKDDYPSVYLDFENNGFGGDLYVSYAEFTGHEYRDPGYIHELINHSDWTLEECRKVWEEYLNDIGTDPKKYADIDKYYYVLYTSFKEDAYSELKAGPMVLLDDAYTILKNETIADLVAVRRITPEKAIRLWTKAISSTEDDVEELTVSDDLTEVLGTNGFTDEFKIVQA